MRLVFSFIYVALLTVFPLVTFAQIVPCDGPNCDWGSLLELGQNILDFMIQLSIVIAAGMFAYAGVLFFSDTGNAQNIERGKNLFSATVIGIVIVLVAWLVVNTLLETLTGEGLDERANEVGIENVDIERSIG